MTYYYKGYNTMGTMKIIHRYLPIKVSELIVYYYHGTRPKVDGKNIYYAVKKEESW